MTLTGIAVLIICISFIMLIVALGVLLGHAEILFGFSGATKAAEAIVVGFITRGLDTPDDPQSANPILEYHNEFTGQTVRKEMFNSGMLAAKDAVFKKEKSRIVHAGDRVWIQYTPKKARVVDPKFVSPDRYKPIRYILPPVFCIAAGFAGFILLAVSVVVFNG